MDLYLPALPALTLELDAATSVAQLTITACLIGLAAGQLIAGPLSDRFGRRSILLAGIVAYILTSALCAISPTIELLIAARFVQGLAGGVGIVIAQAAGRDIYSGGALIRFYGRLTVVGGFAAIVGPLLGGILNTVTDWRGLFVFLAAIGAGILIVTLLVFRETLADRAAHERGLRGDTARLPHPARRSGVPRRGPQSGVPVCGAVRLSLRCDLRAAGHLRTLPARLRAGLRAQLGRLHDLRIPLRPRRRAVERRRHPHGRHPDRRTRRCGPARLGVGPDASVAGHRVAVPPRQRRRHLIAPSHHARPRRLPADRRHSLIASRHDQVRVRRRRRPPRRHRRCAQHPAARRRHHRRRLPRRRGLPAPRPPNHPGAPPTSDPAPIPATLSK